MLCGYAGKFLRVNLSNGEMREESFPEECLRKYIGGSGLGAYLLYQETSPTTDPLGPENLLMFLTGPLTGTKVPSSGRMTVVAKSPLTGIWGEANVGGYWGKNLKEAGYDGVIVEGQSLRPVYIWITNGRIEIRDAGHVWGLDTYEADEVLRSETAEGAVVCSIGQAGERLVKLAAIMTDGKHGRAAARCGLGAVMGSKKLKAIVVRGQQPVPVADSARLAELNKKLGPTIVKSSRGLNAYGTAGAMTLIEQLGDLPIKNWTLGRWEEGAKKLSGVTMAQTILSGRFYCAGCMIGCGREVKVGEGPFAPVDGGGPEYEPLGTMGGECLVDNLEAVALACELCNRYGLDQISTGAVIAFAMEAFERGLLTQADTDGLEIKWGDPDVLIELVKKIGFREGIGELLGQGVKAAACKLGGIAHEFALHVKGLELPGHDPRAHNSVGVSYATSNRGACHLQATSHIFERSVTMPELGMEQVQDRFAIEGKGIISAKLQDLMCMFDSLVLCKFLLMAEVKLTHLLEFTNAVTGWDMDQEGFMKTGERLYNLKRMYNVRLGISRKDDTLPPRILTHKRGSGGAATNLPNLGLMLSEYYAHRGWSEMGIPLPEKLRELGLEFTCSSIPATVG